jgi:phospholipid/cholesterol/gamma-HCH transport system permease protein
MSYQTLREAINSRLSKMGLHATSAIRDVVHEVGEVYTFGVQGVRLFFVAPRRWGELILHMEFIGNKSVMIIVLSGLFTGLALAYQIYLGFKIVNATALVGPTVGLGITRELGPVLTGLIVSARAGGAMAARIGTMRVTEQIDAMEVMGVNPMQFLVSPRILAAALVMPLLTGVFDFMAMLGCYIICIYLFDLDEASFIERTTLYLEPYHINEGLFKAAVFGFFFAIICSHRGFTTKGGAAGVGQSTNKGVVLSMVMIIVMDFFLTNLINVYYQMTAAVSSAR